MMDETTALETAIDKEFAWRYNTYGMVRWGLGAFKCGWASGKTGSANPYENGRYRNMKADIWQRGKVAYQAWKSANVSASAL